MAFRPDAGTRKCIVAVVVLYELAVIYAALAYHRGAILALTLAPPLLAAPLLGRGEPGPYGSREEPDGNAERKSLLRRPVSSGIGLVVVFAIILGFVLLIRWAIQRYASSY